MPEILIVYPEDKKDSVSIFGKDTELTPYSLNEEIDVEKDIKEFLLNNNYDKIFTMAIPKDPSPNQVRNFKTSSIVCFNVLLFDYSNMHRMLSGYILNAMKYIKYKENKYYMLLTEEYNRIDILFEEELSDKEKTYQDAKNALDWFLNEERVDGFLDFLKNQELSMGSLKDLEEKIGIFNKIKNLASIEEENFIVIYRLLNYFQSYTSELAIDIIFNNKGYIQEVQKRMFKLYELKKKFLSLKMA
jgi:hypothetical protein